MKCAATSCRFLLPLIAVICSRGQSIRADETTDFFQGPARTSDPALAANIKADRHALDDILALIDNGDFESVKTLVSTNKQLLRQTTEYDSTCFMSAACYQPERVKDPAAHMKIIEFLLEQGADINATDRWGDSALSKATFYGNPELVTFLLAHGAHLENAGAQFSQPIHSAARGSKSAILKTLLDTGAPVDTRDYRGRTALFEALSSGHNGMDTIDMLLEHGADANARDDLGQTPLFNISYYIHPNPNLLLRLTEAQYSRTVTVLREKGADINARDYNGNTPLHCVVTSTDYPFRVDELLAQGADPNLKNLKGDLPLHVALRSEKLQATELKTLIERTARGVKDGQGYTPLEIVLCSHRIALRDALLPTQASTDLLETVLVAASKNDGAALTRLLKKNAWLANARLPDGTTALHIAALWAAQDAVQTLFEFGADINARDARARTPLHLALHAENDLLSRADIDYTVKALLARDADRGCIDEDGNTPLMNATALGRLSTVKLILDEAPATPAWIDAIAKDDTTAMLRALRVKNPDTIATVKLLLEKGANVNLRSGKGITPLGEAARSNNIELLDLLIGRGGEIEPRTRRFDSPLGVAMAGYAQDSLKYLLEHGADPNGTSEGGSILERSIWNEYDSITTLLIDKGANLNTALGQTPLTQAVMRNKKDIVALLLQKGADPNMPNREGSTALQIARRGKKTELIEMLEKNGAK